MNSPRYSRKPSRTNVRDEPRSSRIEVAPDTDDTAACCANGKDCPLTPGGCAGNCNRASVREVVCRIGDKWAVYVVCTLKNGPLRFNELKRHISGISQRMLALTLRGLERDGLITRSVCRHVPVKVSYALTALGQTLVAPVCSLISWAESHLATITESRKRFDREDDKPVE